MQTLPENCTKSQVLFNGKELVAWEMIYILSWPVNEGSI